MLSSSLRLEVTFGGTARVSSSVLLFGIEKIPLVVVNCQGHPSPLLRREGISQGFPLINRAAVKVKLQIGPPSGVPLWSNTLISAVGGGVVLPQRLGTSLRPRCVRFLEVVGFLFPLY